MLVSRPASAGVRAEDSRCSLPVRQWQFAVLRQLGPAHRPTTRQGRADDARPHRSRRAAPHPRALPDDQAVAPRDRRPGRPDRSAAAHRARARAIAAKLVGEVAGASRFSTDAKLARAAGVAPIPVSSGKTNRHRLDRGGNRQINAAIHRVSVTRLRCHPETKNYIARKRAEGKSTKVPSAASSATSPRRVWHLLQPPHPDQGTPPSPSIS